jgi:primosomal protein N' (replication factor Y) (superfamily II helicase)
MPAVARVAVVSNLPQLDKLFDYLVPDELAYQTHVGSRVKVPFGKGLKIYDGFVIEIDSTSNFAGQLTSIQEVIGSKPSLSSELIEFLQELAIRSASSLGEILKLAVPPHMPRAFKSHSGATVASQIPQIEPSLINQGQVQELVVQGSRHAALARPGISSVTIGADSRSFPSWVQTMCSIAAINILAGKSAILAVPDFRDQEILLEALDFCNLQVFIANFSQEQTKSKIYEAYLGALDETPRVIVGSRSVILAPAYQLGSIAIFDDGDHSFTDQSAPYLNTRDSALLRQSIQKCSLIFLSHSRSTDIQRLVETGYLAESSESFPKPKMSVSEPGFRVDSHAYKAIKKGLEAGAVLVQVASRGESTALFCASCDKKVFCQVCSGPVWVDGSGARKCRWCNAFSPAGACQCGSLEISKGRAGASRTAAELGRAFPGAKVVESTGDNRILRVNQGRTLVIATAGAEPFVDSGYRSVVMLDAQTLLSRQNLRATEDAVRLWSNAVSKLAVDGEAVLVGVSGSLSQKFCLWQQIEIAADELSSRRELMLPPALRLGSIAGTQALLVELAQSLTSFGAVKVLGPAPHFKGNDTTEWRLIVKYSYSDTVEVAKHLRGEAIRLSRGKSVLASSGRAVRALKVRMSDGDVV